MKISSERTVTQRYFGIFNYAMFGSRCRVHPDKGNSTELIPCINTYINYLKRNNNSFVTTK